jgi:hypothetical protein
MSGLGPWCAGRVVELEAALADSLEKLEKATGKRSKQRFHGVMPLVNVRALQSDKERRVNHANGLGSPRLDLVLARFMSERL